MPRPGEDPAYDALEKLIAIVIVVVVLGWGAWPLIKYFIGE